MKATFVVVRHSLCRYFGPSFPARVCVVWPQEALSMRIVSASMSRGSRAMERSP